MSLSPPEYESRRQAAGNVNRLLGELDATIMGKLANEVEVVVVDEFARSARSYLEPFVPDGVRLEVRPRAEDDAAVAAASIVARARQLEEIERLSERVRFRITARRDARCGGRSAGGRRMRGRRSGGGGEDPLRHHVPGAKDAEKSDGGDP